ncbi:MAG: HAD family phosphatase [Pseudomonadota bacterium]
METPKAVLFDCDGVVVDSERLTNLIIQDDLASRGLALTLDQIMATFVGGTMAGVGEKAAKMGADIPDTWLADIYPKIYRALGEQVELVPGILPVLDALDAHSIRYAIGSNGEIKKMETTLGRTGLLDRFQGVMFSGQAMGAPKPAPDVYLHAARALGVTPAQAIVIEDSRSGAAAAHAAGMRCFGFARDTQPAAFDGVADVIFDDMADLPSLLGVSAA